MKCITLTQPWATLVAIGAKRIETRSWQTPYRGPLAIHAAKGLGPVGGEIGLWDLCSETPFFEALSRYFPVVAMDKSRIKADDLPRGAVIAVCELVGCHSTNRKAGEIWNDGQQWHIPAPEPERSFGDYSRDRYGWFLANIRALPEPVPAKGALSLWEWEPPEGFVFTPTVQLEEQMRLI